MKVFINILFFIAISVAFSPIANAQNEALATTPERYQTSVFKSIDVTRNIVYGSADRYDIFGWNIPTNLRLDFYEPDPAGETITKRPLVLVYFGGAFLVGDKGLWDVNAWCDSLAHHGYACAGVNYRLGFNVLSEASGIRAVYRAIQDSRAAVRYFKEFHEEYGIDTSRIYVVGNSAGAYTALHTAFLNKEQDRPEETYGVGGFLNPERRDLGCIDCAVNDYQHSVEVSGVVNLWGAIYDTTYIDPVEQIPVMSIHGTDDSTVPIGAGRPFGGLIPAAPTTYGSEPIHERLNNLGIPNEFHPFEGEGHAFYGSLLPNNQWEEVFSLGRDFLWNTLTYDSAAPRGTQAAYTGTTATYIVDAVEGTTYYWNVIGGTILEQHNTEIKVQWDVISDENKVMVTAVNQNDIVGATKSIDVQVTTPLIADTGVHFGNNANGNFSINEVYPIPASTSLSVRFKDAKAATITIKIHDMAGKLLQTQLYASQAGNNIANIDVSALSQGMYVLSLEKGGTILRQKFVK